MLKKVLLFGLTLSVFLACVSCKRMDEAGPVSSRPDSPAPVASQAPTNYELARGGDGMLEEGSVAVSYPILDEPGLEAINELIAQKAKDGIAQVSAQDFTQPLQIYYSVNTCRAAFISIFYEGQWVDEVSSISATYSTNIDVAAGKTVGLADIVNLDSGFVKLFRDTAKATVSEEYQPLIDAMTDEELSAQLNTADTQDAQMFSTFNNGTMFVFLRLPDNGGYLNLVSLPFDQWKSFVKDVPYFDEVNG